MSQQYDEYLHQHITSVERGFLWIEKNLPELIYGTGMDSSALLAQIQEHDQSKYASGEYREYDDYFYGEKTDSVIQAFNSAWNHHQKCNKHHWQYWVLINDDDGKPVPLDMPLNYILEMVCDWWAFSWTKNNLLEIFDFWESHKQNMILSTKTQSVVEDILEQMRAVLVLSSEK